MNFDYKNVLIYGYSRSGKAVENVLQDINVNYKVYDKNIKISGGKYLLKLNKKTLKTFDLIVISPGISIYDKYVKIADNLHIKVISELEFGFWFTSAEIIAITGTNGKTTTTNLITQVLKNAGFKTEAYGNIGNPLSNAYKKELDYIVCEVSSFQLEATDKFAPYISILLNITEDHIDRHKTFKNYILTKQSIFKNCKTSDYAIIGNASDICDNISKNVVADVITFGTERSNLFVKDNKILLNGEKIYELKKKAIKFTFLDNILPVFAVMNILGIDYTVFNKCNFDEKLNHRMEVFLSNGGVTYIDDSKATNPDSTLKAVSTIKGDIILLLGGLNKKMSFKSLLLNLPPNVKKIITFGKSAREIYRSLKSGFDCVCCRSLKQATDIAFDLAKSGDTVLLSPACASFDEFGSYAERGEYFKQSIIDRVNVNDKTKK